MGDLPTGALCNTYDPRHSGAREARPRKPYPPIVRMDSGPAPTRAHPAMTALIHAHEIPLADLNAVMAQNPVGDGGMEVELGEREVRDELLALQRHGFFGTHRKGDVPGVGALEL